ncbi:TIGR00297 family protein [Methanotorris igneus]|uniref:TIGR00297 family protein n=1 Tax=Methanotorris igneus (strain DSM 5666 / JCM 11834 / Kol 5) TaxID=880724 RepID=F6BCH9_METIK|nr:TIGR00297 family protein [Methanotorris igneus]AEF96190.1 protein of unknown function DUF92 transmembrane [Methanotorris igneus Kol 5]
MDIISKFFLAVVIVCILALLIKKSDSLDNCGICASSIMAFIIILGAGLSWLVILLSFFILGVLVSKMGYSTKKKMGLAESRRTIRNVLANGLVPLLFVIMYCFGFKLALFGYIGSIAAATSDTFSSELGVLSKETPRLITTLKKVEKGTDGGITFFGTFMGLLGAFLIGVVSYLLFKSPDLIWIATISGILGNLADSLCGAVFERRGIMNKEHVNFIATLVGGICGLLLA